MFKKRIESEYIIFDLDGTLLDSKNEIVEAFNFALSKNKLETADQKLIISWIGNTLGDIFKGVTGLNDSSIIKSLEKDYREYYLTKGVKEATLFPGARETLKILKEKGKKFGIASNKPDFLGIEILKNAGIFNLFDAIAMNNVEDSQGIGKKEKSIKKVLTEFGTVNAIMVGDSPIDIKSAKNLGLLTVAAAYGCSTADLLLAEQPDVLIQDISELKFVIG